MVAEPTVRLDPVEAFKRNLRFFGFRRQIREELPKGLRFLALLITVCGVNDRVARQINFLQRYLGAKHYHGFRRQLRKTTTLCLLLA